MLIFQKCKYTDLTIDAQVPEDLTEEDSEAITLTEPLRFKAANITGNGNVKWE